MNLVNLIQQFNSEAKCRAYIEHLRWPEGAVCPRCQSKEIYRLENRPLLLCSSCEHQFSVTVGTIFHDTHLQLEKWFLATILLCESKKGMSACQIQRSLGVSYKTAWYLCHRIRKAMQELSEPLGGQGQVVEIDETFLGGKTHYRRTAKDSKDRKVKVFGMVERGGRVRLQRVENLKAGTLGDIYKKNVSENADRVVTDGAATYSFFVPKDKHVPTNHKQELWDTGTVSMKTIEGAFSLFKRGVIGSYHHLSTDHLDPYLGEFCWRYNRRGIQPWMFGTLLRELVTKKPMTYRHLTREVF